MHACRLLKLRFRVMASFLFTQLEESLSCGRVLLWLLVTPLRRDEALLAPSRPGTATLWRDQMRCRHVQGFSISICTYVFSKEAAQLRSWRPAFKTCSCWRVCHLRERGCSNERTAADSVASASGLPISADAVAVQCSFGYLKVGTRLQRSTAKVHSRIHNRPGWQIERG